MRSNYPPNYGAQRAVPGRGTVVPRAQAVSHGGYARPAGAVPQAALPRVAPQGRVAPYAPTVAARGSAVPAASPYQQGVKGGKGRGQPMGAVRTPIADVYPFQPKSRRLVDHRARTQHRKEVHPFLVRTVAHWLSMPPGTVPYLHQHVDVSIGSPEEPVALGDRPAPPSDPSALDVRVLLSPGVVACAGGTTHLLKRAKVYGRRAANGTLSCYGGRCSATNDQEAVQFLKEELQSQAGIDLSDVVTWYKLVELQYKTKAGQPSTVIYLPALWETSTDLTLRHLCRETTEEKVVRELAEEVSRDGLTEEEYQAAVEAAKTERTVTETKREMLFAPHELTLADALSVETEKGMAKETLEFYTATDALDEFLKREMCTRVYARLAEKAGEVRAKQEQAIRAVQEKKKREERRAELREQHRQKMQSELAELKKKWDLEDQGKTDDEKLEAEKERKRIAEEMMQLPEEEMEDEEETTKVKTRFVRKLDEEALAAFQFFERPFPGPMMAQNITLQGRLPVVRLQHLLLCAGEDITMQQVNEALQPFTENGETIIEYRMCCHNEVEEEEPEPEPEPEPEQAMQDGDAAEGEAAAAATEEKAEEEMAGEEAQAKAEEPTADE